MGAYHIGAFQALNEYEFEPDWVCGISIGAISGAIIAGNAESQRLVQLDRFWDLISRPWLMPRPKQIIMEGGIEGRVVETHWRATQLLTKSNDLAIIPNSIISKARLLNASAPTHPHGFVVTIRLDPTTAPLSGVAVLETAMLSCKRILREPRAIIMIRSLDAVALECEITFFVDQVEQGPAAQNEVFDRVSARAKDETANLQGGRRPSSRKASFSRGCSSWVPACRPRRNIMTERTPRSCAMRPVTASARRVF